MDSNLVNSTGLSNEEISAAADAAQSMPNQEFTSQDLETPRQDSDADIWGIKGLLGIIKIEDSDKSKLALGVDLTSLGLNMNQPEYPQKVNSTDIVSVHCFQISTRPGRIFRLDTRHTPILIQSMIYQPVIEWEHLLPLYQRCPNFPTRRYSIFSTRCHRTSSKMLRPTNCTPSPVRMRLMTGHVGIGDITRAS